MTTSFPPFRPTSTGRSRSTERPPPFFLATRRAESGGTIRLILAGELDLAANLHFGTTLEAAQADCDRVKLDLGALTLIDCAGLATIFAAARRAHRERAVLILLAPRGQVRRLLDLVGTPSGVGILDRDDLPEPARPVAA